MTEIFLILLNNLDFLNVSYVALSVSVLLHICPVLTVFEYKTRHSSVHSTGSKDILNVNSIITFCNVRLRG